jgi:POT family proton-dependent oligopeptide transporter
VSAFVPRQLLGLAITEGCERFSYYGIRGILVLFLTASAAKGGLHWDQAAALRLIGWFVAGVYILPVLGGLFGDRFSSARRAVWLGTAVLIFAYSCLAAAAWLQRSGVGPVWPLYTALVLIGVGTGLFKPNITTLVGRVYRNDDPARERGFLIFYLFMNVGALLCSFVVGTLGEDVAWSLGFLAAAIAMVISGICFSRWRPSAGAPQAHMRRSSSFKAAPLSQSEKAAIAMVAGLGICATIFWVGLEQMSGLLNLFAFHDTRRDVWSFRIPATWFQSLNPVLGIALAPIFAVVWTRFAARGLWLRAESKLLLGFVAMACAFAVMNVAAHTAQLGTSVSPFWLVGAYFLITVGELCIWPICLAATTRLAPQRHSSLIVGLLYLAIAIGGWCAGQIGALVEHMRLEDVFRLLSGIFVVAAVLLAAALPLLGRLGRRATPIEPFALPS